MMIPDARYQLAIMANAGFYTFPDRNLPYPYGFNGLADIHQPVGACLRRNVVVLLGMADTDVNNRELRHNHLADSQGLNRYLRGLHFFQAIVGLAKAWRINLQWQLV